MDSSPHSAISSANNDTGTNTVGAGSCCPTTQPEIVPGIPTYSTAPANLRCCCGRQDCALLEHNSLALEGLEKDLATAARLGQALLHRHESYMAEAEEDRQRLVDNVDALEREKRLVQAENARIVEENRSLLEQLEGLNQSVAESDDRVESLTLTLESTQAELRRLTVAASRAAELEAQLVLVETEQSRLQECLSSAHEDEKSAMQRWRNAESALRDLNDQVERIEAEAREERERHEELVQRMERKRHVERELDNAAGRLKGAAAASEIGRNPGTPVVSRFVKDILQDNANLQVGIMELREMLESSNQEVQNLRDQVLFHQPLAGIGEEQSDGARTPTLCEELESKERRVSQEFHIHHHYHTPSTKKDKGSANRRVKKKRPSLGSPVPLHSAMGTNSPRRSIHRSQSSGSSLNTILSHTSVSIPPPSSSRRWSYQSPPADSLASSPQSAFRTSSIFDRVDRGMDFSEPTSPESTVFSSPLMQARALKGIDMPFRPLPGLGSPEIPENSSGIFNDEHYDRTGFLDLAEPVIPEESEPSSSGIWSQHVPGDQPTDNPFGIQIPLPTLRKSSSHDSLLSVAGMDIHTPITRHSRMGGWHPGMRIPQRIVSPSVELVSTPPVLSAPIITVDRARAPEMSSRSLLASMAASNSVTTETASVVSAESASTSSTTPVPRKTTTLGRRMGGWVLGKWGTAPVPTECDENEANETTAPNEPGPGPGPEHESESIPPPPQPNHEPETSQPIPTSNNTTHSLSSTPNLDSPPQFRFRFTGVNQKGPILGFRPRPEPRSQFTHKALTRICFARVLPRRADPEIESGSGATVLHSLSISLPIYESP
ncbi:hypothetical protein N7481_007226 [Penicillium waksmanii]|uniref:uncharacterized protein n=1 Tax=Penicillium waksmanii TaxID=69791 RepID=UPI0025473496|nr:uncharacterized protein N7481_007226 [Penicillium waksmanii]KAJ5979928.1 hypothetical protein N7481_007226 [Penicillium waksmanii]